MAGLTPGVNRDDDSTRRNPDGTVTRRKVYAPTKSGKGLFGEVGNFFTDFGRNTMNFLETVGKGVSGQEQSPRGGGLGDSIYGRAPGQGIGRSGRRGGRVFDASPSAALAEPDPAPAFGDYLSLLQGAGSGGSVVPFQSFDPYRDEARTNRDASAEALRSVYSQLQRELGDAGTAITNRYAESGKTLEGIGDEASSNIDAAYDQAQTEQADMLKTLGIQDAIAQAVQDKRDLAGQGALAQENLQRGMAADQSYNTAVGASEGTYNDRLEQAGSVAGAQAQTNLEKALNDRLREIDIAEAEANADAGSMVGGTDPMDIISQAWSMYQDDSDRYYDREQDAFEAAQRGANDDPMAKLAQVQQLLKALAAGGTVLPEGQEETFLKYLLG